MVKDLVKFLDESPTAFGAVNSIVKMLKEKGYKRLDDERIEKGGKDKKLAVGLIADIHSGSTYIPLRVNGIDRFPPSFEPDDIDEVPDELLPVNTQIDLLNLAEGDGRNDNLFRYA